jgi:4-amino-4-deoxy-L-arabinose transferase-like glycosyltransferase
MMDNSGTPGLFRLFGVGLAGQISWLLPFALIGLLAWWRRPSSFSRKGFEEAGYFSERGLTLLATGLWLLPGLLYFSFTTGFWHTYYLATIAPPLAALVGIDALGMYEAYRSGGIKGWLLVAAVPVTGLIETLFLYYDVAWSSVLIPVLLTGVTVTTVLMVVLKLREGAGTGNLQRTVACAAIALLFIAPVAWACTPLVYGNGGILPVAGPQLDRGGAGMGGGFNEIGDSISPRTEYLLSHKTTETWLVGVSSANSEGAGLIISTGEPVMSMGGFSGSDQILTEDSLKDLIDAGRIRYFLGSSSGGGGIGSGNSGLFTWISANCAAVPAADWGGSTTVIQDRASGSGNGTATKLPGFGTVPGLGAVGPGGQNTLYDCAGYRGQTST